jgi:hypothetical protein
VGVAEIVRVRGFLVGNVSAQELRKQLSADLVKETGDLEELIVEIEEITPPVVFKLHFSQN